MDHQHVFIKGSQETSPTLLLLHGTGGNERDLIPLAQMIAPDASILGVKGNVLENGMPRFFRRLSEGVFDIEDLKYRTEALYQFISSMSEQYHFDRQKVIAIGYSNGANIAASLIYQYERAIRGAILFHAMVPLQDVTLPPLHNLPVFIGAGKRDPLIPMQETLALADTLREAGANVTEYWGEGGHELTRAEVEEAGKWYREHY